MASTSANGPKFIIGDFNARIGQQRPREHHIIGPHTLGTEARHQVEMPNDAHGMAVANTFCNVPADEQVTHYEPRVAPLAPVCASALSMLDLLLVSQTNRRDAKCVQNDRLATLATSHFPMTAWLCVNLASCQLAGRKLPRGNWSVLQSPATRRALAADSTARMSGSRRYKCILG